MAAPIVTSQRLRFCDTDQLGHVNNAVYAEMFEAGRVEMLAPLRPARAGPHAVVIARLEIDYLREMNWPGEVGDRDRGSRGSAASPCTCGSGC